MPWHMLAPTRQALAWVRFSCLLLWGLNDPYPGLGLFPAKCLMRKWEDVILVDLPKTVSPLTSVPQ